MINDETSETNIKFENNNSLNIDLFDSISDHAFLKNHFYEKESKEEIIEKELHFYLNLKFNIIYKNPLSFWSLNNNNLKYLTKLAYQILVINASSANSERNISLAGNIIIKNRNRIKADLLEALMIIKLDKYN